MVSGIVILPLLISYPAAANAEPASVALVNRAAALSCGYDGHVNGRPTYNHCGRGSVVIKVDHLFWQHTYACMPRGVHAIPQGNVSWAVIGAEFDGHTCTYTEPVVVAGP
jgi:hypothetical protein